MAFAREAFLGCVAVASLTLLPQGDDTDCVCKDGAEISREVTEAINDFPSTPRGVESKAEKVEHDAETAQEEPREPSEIAEDKIWEDEWTRETGGWVREYVRERLSAAKSTGSGDCAEIMERVINFSGAVITIILLFVRKRCGV